MAAYRWVCDSRHLQTDCQEPGSALKLYARQSSTGYLYLLQVNLLYSAPPVKNWRILLVQSFTAHMPLLTATSTFGLGRRRWSSPQQFYLHCLRTCTETLSKQWYVFALVAVSKGTWAVKHCTNNWNWLMQVDLYNGRKMVVVVVAL